MIHRLEATLILSTPLIMSGHAPLTSEDSVRPSAIKGALRFWWRALQWPTLRAQAGSDNEALKVLHERESTLFGSAAGESGQQAAVLLRIDGQHKLDKEVFAKGKDLSRSYPGAVYLMGQGQHSRGDGSKCAGLQSTHPVQLTLIWRDDRVDGQAQQSLIEAVQALGLLGSVGARARKGFGSLSLQTLSLDGSSVPVPANVADIRCWFTALSHRFGQQALPPFTAFGPNSHCWALPLQPSSDALGLLNEYGMQMMRYRLSDKSAFGGQQGRGLFKGDSRELRKLTEGDRPSKAPKRASFGLPNNVFFMDNKQTVEVNPERHERRASPLMAHLHQFPNKERVMLATLLPAQFLPANEGLKLKHKGKQHALPFEPDWNVIKAFIEQCNGQELIR